MLVTLPYDSCQLVLLCRHSAITCAATFLSFYRMEAAYLAGREQLLVVGARAARAADGFVVTAQLAQPPRSAADHLARFIVVASVQTRSIRRQIPSGLSPSRGRADNVVPLTTGRRSSTADCGLGDTPFSAS